VPIPHLATNWKSTVSSVLTATLATSAAFLTPPLNALVSPKVILYLGAAQIIGKIWIGLLQQDAGTTMAVVPGSSTPQAVPSHEVPDQPAAKVVLPASNTPKE
jgi:hypothetical protein